AVQCGLRATRKNREHDVRGLTAFNRFGACLFNSAEQAIERRSSSTRFFQRGYGGNQRSERDCDDADDHEQFEQGKAVTALKRRRRPVGISAARLYGRRRLTADV